MGDSSSPHPEVRAYLGQHAPILSFFILFISQIYKGIPLLTCIFFFGFPVLAALSSFIYPLLQTQYLKYQ
jgi:ABC-type amino acid transport system permease subunit